MKLSSTMNLLLAGAALLASTPGADAAERKLRGRQRNTKDSVNNDNNVRDFPIADEQDAQRRRKLGEFFQDGALCGPNVATQTSFNCKAVCKDGYSEFWHSKGAVACGHEPAWEPGTLCGAGTTCDNCKDGYYEFWDSLFFTACGREPCWPDGDICAAGTTCNNCCNSYHWSLEHFFTVCGV
ncbi:hypothetical protein ACHAXT_005984 [Thalassiosira profunda]